jgi:hypothetical protein
MVFGRFLGVFGRFLMANSTVFSMTGSILMVWMGFGVENRVWSGFGGPFGLDGWFEGPFEVDWVPF